VKMVCDVVDRYDISGRKIVVLTIPGDRRDEDIDRGARIAAPAASITTSAAATTTCAGAGPDEIPELLRQRPASRPASRGADRDHRERGGGQPAALEMARGGDLLLILADQVTRSWKQIIYFQPGEDVVSEHSGAPHGRDSRGVSRQLLHGQRISS
jgi:cyanophycin synthetase